MAAELVITNDDGVAAEGIHALTRAVAVLGVPAVVVAPADNRSGASRLASYGTPVEVENLSTASGIPHHACSGSTVDCVRTALLGDIAPGAKLVVSGINHGPNLGDDTLNSGTVAGASEAALLGAQGLAVSQQHFDGHFHILDSFDQTTPVYSSTAAIAAVLAGAMLEQPGPDRAYLNLNVPAMISEKEIEVTRLGRRYYRRGSVRPKEHAGRFGYLTFGECDDPPPEFEAAAGTDFAAMLRRRVSVTPLTYDWGDAGALVAATKWARELCAKVSPRISHLVGEAPAGP